MSLCFLGLVTNYGEWGATELEGGGAREVLPLQKGGGGSEKVQAVLKGGGAQHVLR